MGQRNRKQTGTAKGQRVKRTKSEEDVLVRRITAYRVGFARALSEPIQNAQLHLASGFLLEEGPGKPIVVTAGHFCDFVKQCLNRNTVEGLCVLHQDRAHEQNLIHHMVPLEDVNLRMRSASNGFDVGVFFPGDSLVDSLTFHEVKPSVLGMSGGLVLLANDSDPEKFAWIGQQSSESRSKEECKYLRATRADNVVRGVLNCIDQYQDSTD